jgi:hypothetical protein
MGGGGDLLGLALSVPPWEPLHELSFAELRQTNLVTDLLVADGKGEGRGEIKPAATPVRAVDKPVQDRFATTALPDVSAKPVSDTSASHLGQLAVDKSPQGDSEPGAKSTRTAEAASHQ